MLILLINDNEYSRWRKFGLSWDVVLQSELNCESPVLKKQQMKKYIEYNKRK